MAFNASAYFDLEQVLINEISGGLLVFLALGIIIILFAASKFNIGLSLSFMFCLLFLMIVWLHTSWLTLGVFTIMIIGMLAFATYSKFFNRT